jgi:hypothetical protein
MRRTILLALFAALLLVPTTTAHAQGREDILRDCADDGRLEGNYSASKLRDARNNIPAELEEYSDCRDVLSREISAKASASSNNGGDTSGGTPGGTTNSGGGTGGGTTTAPSATATPDARPQRTGKDQGVVTGPSTPEDWKAIDGAIAQGAAPVPVNGRPISPAASVGRNGIPGTLVVVLALLAAASIAVTVPFVRRRAFTRSTPA